MMFHNLRLTTRNMQHATRSPRGSVLIFVVALLTLVALIGTALIATARIDRHNSAVHVETTTDNATHDRFTDLLKEKVLRAIARGYGKDVDSARTDSWLGDRLPVSALQAYYGGTLANDTPVWRFPSGIIDRYDAELIAPEYWRPPFQYNPALPVTLIDTNNAANNQVKLDSTNLGSALVPSSLSITYPNDHPEEAIRGKTRTFPAGFFVDRTTGNSKLGSASTPLLMGDADGDGIADAILFQLSASPVNGVAYYGAIRVVDNNSAVNVNTAWSRDTEFNTEPLYTSAGLNPAARTNTNSGFFPSDIGLYELLDPSTTHLFLGTNTAEGGGRPARDNELAELDEYRLGYQTDSIRSGAPVDKGGWVDAFEDNKTNGGPRSVNTIQDMRVSFNNGASSVHPNLLVAIEDRMQDPGDTNTATNPYNPDPDVNFSSEAIGNWTGLSQPDARVRPDFTFTTQNEALYTMASRRWESIRYGADLNANEGNGNYTGSAKADRDTRNTDFATATPYNVDKNQGDDLFANKKINGLTQTQHALFPYRWFDEQEAAALAYRFCLVDPNGNQSSLDAILRHSAYRSAPNWKPGLSDSNSTWRYFPANEYVFWFQTLNFDGDATADAPYAGSDPVTGFAYPTDMSYLEAKSYADTKNAASLANSNGNQPRFRSIRPLITTHNPVNTSAISRSFVYDNNFAFQFPAVDASTGIDWNRDTTADDLYRVYPGMVLNDMVTGSNAGQFRVPTPWVSGGPTGTGYNVGDIVYNPDTAFGAQKPRIYWMCVKSTVASATVAPWSVGNGPTNNIDTSLTGTGECLYWEPQPWVTGHGKASVNTAGFPELWHSFFLAMSAGAYASPFDSKLQADVTTNVNGGTTTEPPSKGFSNLPYVFPLRETDPTFAGAGTYTTYDQAKLFRFYDPYRGMRYDLTENLGRLVIAGTGAVDPASAAPNLDPVFDAATYNVPENPGVVATPNYEQNALSMFRSVIRDPRFVRPHNAAPADLDNPDRVTVGNPNIDNGAAMVSAIRGVAGVGAVERLTPNQMMTLRSAIAAFNAQDLLNTYGLRANIYDPAYDANTTIPAKTITLYDTDPDYPNATFNPAASEAANQYPSGKNPRPQYEVTIYGNRPQLFISEVFASNDGHAYDFLDPKDVDAGGTNKQTKKRYQNPNGYIAIELYNPYSVTVSTAGWKIGAIDRRRTADGGVFGTATAAITSPDGTGTPIIIPTVNVAPGQRVVIESYSPAVTTMDPAQGYVGTDGFDNTDPEKNPYAAREYRPPASGIVPLWSNGGNEAQWYYKSGVGTYTPMATPASYNAADPSAGTVPIANLVQLPALNGFLHATGGFGREMVILRPRQPGTTPAAEDMVPVDQFDFTGVKAIASAPGTTCQSIHYARPEGLWEMVYPGRYDACRGNIGDYAGANTLGPRRQEGVWVTPRVYAHADPDLGTYLSTPAGGTEYDPWISPIYHSNPLVAPANPADDLPMDVFDPATHAGQWVHRYSGVAFGQTNPTPTYKGTLAIPLAGGPFLFNPLTPVPTLGPTKVKLSPGQTMNQFPFGGFARNGDMLQIPFIAAYRIRKLQSAADGTVPNAHVAGGGINAGALEFPATAILEMNSISMDAAMAEDTNPVNNVPSGENVGRMANANNTAYSWVSNLFRYLDVRVPANDYLPDVNPATYPAGSPLTSATSDSHQLAKPVNNRSGNPNLSIPPGSDPSNYNDAITRFTPSDEANATTQGLININTAPRKVLSMLPMAVNNAGAVDPVATQTAARNIFNYITQTGDINSLFDLNKVSNFQTAIPYSNDQSRQGDIYPALDDLGTPSYTDISGSYKQQYLMMNRISNLVTTKSDTFTVYLLVQGWREAGTQFPVLDWEKRQAFIVDRSTGTLRVTRVPTD